MITALAIAGYLLLGMATYVLTRDSCSSPGYYDAKPPKDIWFIGCLLFGIFVLLVWAFIGGVTFVYRRLDLLADKLAARRAGWLDRKFERDGVTPMPGQKAVFNSEGGVTMTPSDN